MSPRNVYRLQHGTRVTFVLADDLTEAYERARPFLAMQPAVESVELLLVGPVWDPEAVRFELGHPEDFCGRCGRPNVTWFAPSELWNRAVPEGGILCPVCFIQSAEKAGIDVVWCVGPK